MQRVPFNAPVLQQWALQQNKRGRFSSYDGSCGSCYRTTFGAPNATANATANRNPNESSNSHAGCGSYNQDTHGVSNEATNSAANRYAY